MVWEFLVNPFILNNITLNTNKYFWELKSNQYKYEAHEQIEKCASQTMVRFLDGSDAYWSLCDSKSVTRTFTYFLWRSSISSWVGFSFLSTWIGDPTASILDYLLIKGLLDYPYILVTILVKLKPSRHGCDCICNFTQFYVNHFCDYICMRCDRMLRKIQSKLKLKSLNFVRAIMRSVDFIFCKQMKCYRHRMFIWIKQRIKWLRQRMRSVGALWCCINPMFKLHACEL